MKINCLLFLLAFNLKTTAQVKIPPQPNATIWKDTKGNTINAHGGGLLLHNGTYYWFGEIKKGKNWLVPGLSLIHI